MPSLPEFGRARLELGTILFNALIATALISLTLLALLAIQSKGIGVMTGVLLSTKERSLAMARLLPRFHRLCSAGQERWACTSEETLHGFQPTLCALCYRPLSDPPSADISVGSDLRNPVLFPLMNYRNIFAAAKGCESGLPQVALKTTAGFSLSASAAISGATCVFTALPSRTFAVRGNLEFSALPAFGVSPDGETWQAISIAATGYVEATGRLYIDRPTTIISGGDIHLQSVAVPEANLRLTLFSATGVIVIDAIDGAPALEAGSWLGTYLPEGTPSSASPKELDSVPSILLGVLDR